MDFSSYEQKSHLFSRFSTSTSTGSCHKFHLSSLSIHLLHIQLQRQLPQRSVKILDFSIPTTDSSHAQLVGTAGFIRQESDEVSSHHTPDIHIFPFTFFLPIYSLDSLFSLHFKDIFKGSVTLVRWGQHLGMDPKPLRSIRSYPPATAALGALKGTRGLQHSAFTRANGSTVR